MLLPSSFLWPESPYLIILRINLISRSPNCSRQDIVARKVQQQVYFNITDQRLKLVLQFEGYMHASFLLCFYLLAHAWLFFVACSCLRFYVFAHDCLRLVCVSVCAYGHTHTLKTHTRMRVRNRFLLTFHGTNALQLRHMLYTRAWQCNTE